jgi:large repetitive protein
VTISPTDLGEIGSLAKAIGLINGSGQFQEDWLTRPVDYLSAVLANEAQRAALIAFLDAALGGSERRTDSSGRIWLPIIEEDSPDVTIYVALDEREASYVRLGLGVGIQTTSPHSETTFHLPLFKAAKEGQSLDSIVLLGGAGSIIGFATEITIDAAAPTPGAAHLGRIGIGLDVPTSPGEQPIISLTLGALQLPGATTPRDIVISLDSLDELDDVALELVLGLVQAQATGLPPGPLTALAGMLGLKGGGAVPPLPIADFATLGPRALAIWFNQVAGQDSVRAAWFNELATLLGGGATASASGVSFTLGAATVAIGVRVTAGTGGASVITPTLRASIASGSIRAEGEAELARIDLGAGTAIALPQLALFAHLGHTSAGGTPILTGDPSVQAVRVGVALNEDRRPIPVLAADGVLINGQDYGTLDLSTPDAAIESLGTALTDIVDDLLDQLGPIGTVLRVLLGLAPPASAPTVPTVDVVAFLSNPLATVGGHWRNLLRDHATAIPGLLDELRSLIADAGAAISPIAGAGTADDPWRLPLIGPVALQFRSEAGGDRLNVALACAYAVDTLGQRCTRIDTRLIVGLANIDFVTGRLVIAGAVEARLTARARGDTRARFAAGPIAFSADHIGLSANWTVENGLAIHAMAPNPTAEFKGQPIPIALPTFDAGGIPSLDDAGWDAVERLLGLLGSQSPLPAFRDLVSIFGWIAEGPNLADDPTLSGRPHLRLAALVAEPAAALKAWALALLLDQSPRIERAITVLTRQLTGSVDDFGRLAGAGRPDSPYRLPLFGDGVSPQLAFWLEPQGPTRPTLTNVPDEIRDWRPGRPGFDGAILAYALTRETELAESIATLVASRDDLAAGLDALIARWVGTDGRIVPPATDPVGTSVHRFTDVTIDRVGSVINVDQMLGGAPAVRINIAVVTAGASMPWPAAPPDRVIDLRAPGLAPESFSQPSASAGEWYIALGGRGAARLTTGDADGIAGQAARLQRVLPAFAGLGSVALIASAEAGHAARRAAEAVTAVTSLVTIGTPAGPVSFSVLDTAPTAEALRALVALLPAFDPTEPDDFDLARGRALITALTDLLPLGDPAVELRPPDVLPGAPRAGLAVHAVYGSMRAEAVSAALTAVVAAGLSLRAGVRAPQLATPPTGAAFGIYLPVIVRGDGLVMRAEATLDALGFDFTTSGGPSIRTASNLRLKLSLARESGWLVGGPDPARGPGPRPEHELRRIEATMTLPVVGSGTASAEVVLIEPKVFGIGRERWVVRAGGAASTFEEAVTPALPEVRVLLAQLAAELSAATDPAIAAVRQILEGLGVFETTGGFVADGIDHLLNEPAARIAESLANVARRTNLQTGIASLTTALSGVSIDLAARRLTLSLSGVPGTFGMMPWSLNVEIEPNSSPRFDFALETPSAGPDGALSVHVQAIPFSLTLQRHRPGAVTPQIIPVWPNPDADSLLAAITRLAPAEFARLGLEYLRQLDETARPIVDAAYDALGLLGPANTEGVRGVRLPLELIQNPVGWLGHAGALGGAGGFDPAKLIVLFDALKPILGVAGAPGEWNLASGVTLRTDSSAGAARFGLVIDSNDFAPIATAAGRLTIAGTFALALTSGLPPRPTVDLSIGLSGAAPGRRAIHLASDGGLQVFLRPDSGPDLSLYPNPPGLSRLAEVAVTQALPFVLNALADQSGAGLAGDVGAVVRAIGDALALRTGTPARFNGTALQAWAADPAAAFAARLPVLSATALGDLATALDPLLPAPATVSASGGHLIVSIGGVVITLQPTPITVSVAANLSGIPSIQSVEASAVLNATGLAALDLELGPADIDAGGVRLRPYFAAAAGNVPDGGRRIQFGLALDAAGTRKVGARWLLDGPTFALVASDGASEVTDAESVALALVDAVVQLVASFALTTQPVDDLLNTTVPGSAATPLREVLRGVFLQDVSSPTALDVNLFDPDLLLGRMQRLLVNLANTGPKDRCRRRADDRDADDRFDCRTDIGHCRSDQSHARACCNRYRSRFSVDPGWTGRGLGAWHRRHDGR